MLISRRQLLNDPLLHHNVGRRGHRFADLLFHYSRTDNDIIYFRSDVNKQSKENNNMFEETLGNDVCNELLFVHA